MGWGVAVLGSNVAEHSAAKMTQTVVEISVVQGKLYT